MNNIKVANIIEESKLGGPQIRIAHIANALKDIVDTTVILPKANSDNFITLLKKLKVNFKSFSLSRITKNYKVALKYIFFSPIEIFQLIYFFNKKNFDLVHVSGGSWQYKGLIAGKLSNKKVLWHLNDTSMPKIIKLLFSFFSNFADGYIFASESSKKYYKSINKKSFNNKLEFIIPAPVNTIRFNSEKSFPGDEELIDKWVGKKIIGTVANVSPVKGLESFINAAGLINEKCENIHFVVIGRIFDNQKKYYQSLTKRCEHLSMKNFSFVGGRNDVRPLLKRFDIYVCSSIAESSPISVWEAMSMGKSIISTNVGDVPKYINNNVNGFIVEVNNYRQLADRATFLINNPIKSLEFGKLSRKSVIENLDIEICAAKHLNAYNQTNKMYNNL